VIANADSRRRFEVEAKAASRLDHPNCVAVIDHGVDRDAPYLVMDFVNGRTLRAILKDGPLPPERALELACQVLAGLAHAHGHGIIHRDVKPENIIVARVDGVECARIIDFGLAKLQGASTITDNTAVGTPSYMSPEQTLGQRADARSDVYGAGVLVFELLTGTKPFRANTPFDVMRMHREDPVPAFTDVTTDRDIPSAIETVVHKAMAKAPEERYPSAVELSSALVAAAPRRRAASIIDEIERPHYTRIVGIGIAVLVVGIAAWFVFGRPGDAAPPLDAAVVRAPADAAPPAHPDAPAARVELPGIADAVALAHAGKLADAFAALDQLRAAHPDNGQIAYALATINADRERWATAVDAYADALQKDAAYRSDPRVIHDLVQALRSDRAHERAATLIVAVIGSAAIPELDTAATSTDAQLRARAARVRKRLR
jgi:serine/threonine-protein kinase